MNSPPLPQSEIAELQGFYGRYAIPEKAVQGLWAKGVFRQDSLKTISGKHIRLSRRGRWNHLDGPDFRDAEIEIDGNIICGDIEIHLYQKDWLAHGHQTQKGFENVILHVVLFAPPVGQIPSFTARGKAVETLYLLPHLPEDLESLVTTFNPNFWLQDSAYIPSMSDIIQRAEARWMLKVWRANETQSAVAPEEYWHSGVLTALGAQRNRKVFASVAKNWPRHLWPQQCEPEMIWSANLSCWVLSGLRPANHPTNRLHQYRNLCLRFPDWEQSLENLAPRASTMPRIEFQKVDPLSQVFSTKLTATLWSDVVWPNIASIFDLDLMDCWSSFPVGHIPAAVEQLQRHLRKNIPDWPRLNNGIAQGLIGWLVEKALISTTDR